MAKRGAEKRVTKLGFRGLGMAKESEADGALSGGSSDKIMTGGKAISAALAGGEATIWVGRGTGVDDEGLARKRDAVQQAHAHDEEGSSRSQAEDAQALSVDPEAGEEEEAHRGECVEKPLTGAQGLALLLFIYGFLRF